VVAAAGNETLTSMLTGVTSRTTRARAWRGVIERDATVRTITEHSKILDALRNRDSALAEAAALLHVATTENWFRSVLSTNEEPLT
jgi:GntR family transcriptional repressor for pyruvate dehydrogenase complex